MARCDNQTLLSKISQKALSQETEIDLNLLENLPDCKKIVAKNFVAIDGAYSYDAYSVPENRFECMRQGCVNSGTLYAEDATNVTYFLAKDATEYAAGVVTFYVKPAEDATYPLTVDVTLGSEQALTNADKYTVTIEEDQVTADGYVPVVVNLSDTPTDIGEGWTPTTAGTFIKIESEQGIGISSISVFDEIEDFATNDVVKIACLSGIDGSYDISALEATCTQSGYDTTSANNGFDFTLTGKLLTPNFHKLNPMYGKGDATKSFDINTVTKTVEAYTVDEKEYGKVSLADLYQDECGFVAVQIADSCNVTDAQLSYLTIPTLVDVDGGHYQVIKNADGTTDIIFNKSHVGKDVLISYPVEAEVEEVVGDMSNVGNVRVRMSYVKEYSDGTKYRFVYNNVLVTSFPAGITNADEDISFTVNVQPDNGGRYYHQYRILG